MNNLRPALLAALLAAGCDAAILDPDGDLMPRDVEARYEWVEEGWVENNSRPVGHQSVLITWALPTDWRGEVFRVYARENGGGGYRLAATVTSCSDSACRYSDLNVAPGERYDYYVAALDERSGREVASTATRAVQVPTFARPAAPDQVTARALDGAVWIRWRASGAERYRVFLKSEGATQRFVEVGETDGVSFLDTRVQNGTRYGYQIAAVDSLGHIGVQSALVTAVPRPDYHADLIYSTADSLAASGFRFVTSESDNPILSGTASNAQWRLESAGGALRIVPLGQTRVTGGDFTTALTCGPGSESDCISIDVAPATSRFSTGPVTADAARTYVFEVVGSDNRTHYGKIHVLGRTTDSRGRAILVFDWAYQLIPSEPSLSRG